jgi:hypothetical protein
MASFVGTMCNRIDTQEAANLTNTARTAAVEAELAKLQQTNTARMAALEAEVAKLWQIVRAHASEPERK